MKKISLIMESVSRKISVDMGVFIIFFLVTLVFVISVVNTF